MFNPLEVSTDDIKQLFDLSAIDILINGKPSKGFITEGTFFRETEDKNLHTLDPITTGDYISYQGHDYMVINETITKRHSKFKALIRHCNYPVIRKNILCRTKTGETDRGQPIYDYTYGDDYVIPTVTSQRTFSIDERYAIRVIDKAVIVSVQDSELNRNSLFAINEQFKVKDLVFKVINHERSVRGILSIWGELATGGETEPTPIGGIPICNPEE